MINKMQHPGDFSIGCNYWASHAGTSMWSNWQPEVVEADFADLSKAKLEILRVFPLWPDFQPLVRLEGAHGVRVEFRLGEEPLPADEVGQAGVDPDALDHFEVMADLAMKYDLMLVVGLVTGWMSGRLFVPPALQGLNLITDPIALQWQIRFVRCFVRRFRNHPAIQAWDLGNECNCMSPAPSTEAAWLWTASIAGAIRLEDSTRPVISGMHGMLPSPKAFWRIQDQGELTDILTTHPYPLFTPGCNLDPLNSMRPCLHATAQSRFYADISNKPCMVEEIGNLGRMICSDALTADYLRGVLYSLWAHDCRGLLWWCGYDQSHLGHAPYDWNAVERELGLIAADRTTKPALHELTKFRNLLDSLPEERLPEFQTDAVCILTHDQDSWANAYTSFILAKQVGFDIEFQYVDQPLKPASLYLLPGLEGNAHASRRFWITLMEKIAEGATLYTSLNDGIIWHLREFFGIEVQTREARNAPAKLHLEDMAPVEIKSSFRLNLKSAGAEILGVEEDGNPAFTCFSYGRGKAYFLTLPLEAHLFSLPAVFQQTEPSAIQGIYRKIAATAIADKRVIKKNHPQIGITEHALSPVARLVLAINYSAKRVDAAIGLKPSWRVTQILRGELTNDQLYLEAQEMAIFKVENVTENVS